MKGKLKYVGKQSSGISIYLYGTYKQVTLTRAKGYVFTDKDRLDDKAINYYKKFRPMGVELELEVRKVEEPECIQEVTPVVNEEVPLQDASELEVDSSTEEEVESVSAYDALCAMEEDKVWEIFGTLGFKSRKKSLASKISECISTYGEDAILELIK